MNLSAKVSIPTQVMARTVGDETIILDLASGTYYGLDPVGARMWQLMSEGNSLNSVCDSMLGEGVVEFKRPSHTLNDCIGFSRVKKFIADELIPGFRKTGKDCISGALVGGPIGGGKTYICEAVASEVGCPVIILKNIRSKWYGETDQIVERLLRLLETFHKIMIFVDEADAMFGDISSDQETERRLTGKIQAVMSDPALRGRVIWFLMTARVHRLSPDIRRPGRMDLIIPILDPEGEDMDAFIKWAFGELNDSAMADFRDIMKGSSSARYSMMRSQVKSKGCKTPEEIKDVLHDLIEPDIGETRQYQTLQAKVNCTRRSLLVDRSMKPQDFDKLRSDWHHQIVELEKKGIK
jgi:SpoVK/Ycf46/Vps4 family AAA+-type ATPase